LEWKDAKSTTKGSESELGFGKRVWGDRRSRDNCEKKRMTRIMKKYPCLPVPETWRSNSLLPSLLGLAAVDEKGKI
jgi:hypothetical protein